MRDFPVQKSSKVTSIRQLQIKQLPVQLLILLQTLIHHLAFISIGQSLSNEQVLAHGNSLISLALGIPQVILLLMELQWLH